MVDTRGMGLLRLSAGAPAEHACGTQVFSHLSPLQKVHPPTCSFPDLLNPILQSCCFSVPGHRVGEQLPFQGKRGTRHAAGKCHWVDFPLHLEHPTGEGHSQVGEDLSCAPYPQPWLFPPEWPKGSPLLKAQRQTLARRVPESWGSTELALSCGAAAKGPP